MKTLKRYLYTEILAAVGFVTLGFLALFFFFDFVDELRNIGRYGSQGYQISHALIFVTLLLPSHLYELIPISLLIGTIFVMAKLAQNSEFTIMRTSGLGPWRALRTLLGIGLWFVIATLIFGDYIAPTSDRWAQLLKARYQGDITIGQTGAWLKEKQESTTYMVNVKSLASDGSMQNVHIYGFNEIGHPSLFLEAGRGQFEANEWALFDVKLTRFMAQNSDAAKINHLSEAQTQWPTKISPEMVSAALLKPDRMRTLDLFQYIRHLDANNQSAQRYKIEFWRKVFYPLSCLVMIILALPFAYLHFRSAGITSYVFGGVMAGISFFLLNNVFGYIGNLQNWQPWLTAAAPSIIYTIISLTAFSWLVLRR